ncbi:SgrR family transcriptional regulator [Vibrio olivae]|uniref:SgrR family transcriptional regulator n=1 Tax=Vibrio olivae TaxID=1243002 RepID=A0ABV5HRF7_9VIBR
MSSPRLRSQFETLFEHYHGKDCGVQLDEITDILFCTRRNARIVLNKLEEEGWIEWHPAPGRGKLSQLIFKRSRSDVSENLARRYLEDGKIAQALNALDGDTSKLAQVIESYLGVVQREGQHVIRLPYYRPLSMLNPLKPMRRSEQHIVHQVFSGLTRLDSQEQLQPDLAHTWHALTPQVWRFYLRPGVRFHNGDLLTTQMVVESLLALKCKALFDHIASVTSPSDLIVDIQLSKSDTKLPFFLSESCAKILPAASLRGDDFDLLPIGTGPYRVVRNDEQRLVLSAFDSYYGFRPLMDSVEVWVIDDQHSSLIFPSLAKPIKHTTTGLVHDDVELDPGCSYLLLNRSHGLPKDPAWAEYFSQTLSSLNIYGQLPQDKIIELGVLPAHGLKPGWYQQQPSAKATHPPHSGRVKIACHAQHPMFATVMKAMSNLLKADGLDVEEITYELAPEQLDDIDIWIKPMGISSNRDDALAGWLLNTSDIEQFSPRADFIEWTALVEDWMADESNEFPAKHLSRSLIESRQIIPLFHCWLGISKDQCGSLQNAKCNALGWFDFSQVWVKPEILESSHGQTQ